MPVHGKKPELDPVASPALATEVAARQAADAGKQDAATAATDAELATHAALKRGVHGIPATVANNDSIAGDGSGGFKAITPEQTANKGQANGYAGLDSRGALSLGESDTAEDGVNSRMLVRAIDDAENALTVKQPNRTWGSGTYGTGQAFELLKDQALATDIGYTAPIAGDGVLGPDDDLVLFRITANGSLGLGGNFHLATGLRQPQGYGTGGGTPWAMLIQPSIDCEHVRMSSAAGQTNDFLHAFDSAAVEKFRVTKDGNVIAGMVSGAGAYIGNIAGGSGYFGLAHSANATSVNYALSQGALGDTLVNAKTGQTVTLRVNNAARLTVNSTGMGFNGAAAIAKPSVTGSRGSNAALASLLTALANYGLVTDSSTA